MFFSDWTSLLRIVVISVSAYLALVLILRISGNRTLSKMNSFDFIVTIALGSTLAAGILQKETALSDVLLAFTMLVGLQYVTTYLSMKFHFVDKIVKSDPVLLFADGRFLRTAMKDAHVTEAEILAAMREAGHSSVQTVQFVVLETNGKIIATSK